MKALKVSPSESYKAAIDSLDLEVHPKVGIYTTSLVDEVYLRTGIVFHVTPIHWEGSIGRIIVWRNLMIPRK